MTIIALAAALAFGTAAPEPAPSPAPVTAAAEQGMLRSINPEADMRRVCVVDTVTGPGSARRYCQSRALWIAQGTDPLAKR
ncbi:hypothetical protein [Sphingomonas dokdonensis]|uniref:Uncharacterized protein n=1 Tax=Sphingomonas dokdonensis TaxID=344880 RepID=A0A245ZUT2_9SPHN|nr:hypothetical protein [Sphingomonas dokdonensis]OWK33504.1 hypothetical protein SPDO_03830 [Sphingomonas dokdonensis]